MQGHSMAMIFIKCGNLRLRIRMVKLFFDAMIFADSISLKDPGSKCVLNVGYYLFNA